jgi:hypothetical protein
MSDPRYSDSRQSDELRRYGGQGSNGQWFSQLWPWLTAAMTALGLLVGGIIGHSWGWNDYQKKAESSPPATTGSAPSEQRPAPQTR